MNHFNKKSGGAPKRSASLVFSCILSFGFLSHAQTPVKEQPTAEVSGVAAIEAYCEQLDTFKKSNLNGARWFGDVADWSQSGMTLNSPSPKWREFKSRKARESAATGDNLYDVADVWTKDDKIVLADFWFGSPSGDWSQNVTYYFRYDGTLAKMRSTYAGFNINPFSNPEEFGARLVQTRIYDGNGKRLRKRLQCFELGEKGRQKKCAGDYSRYEGVAYLKVQRLPLYNLLNSRSQYSALNDVTSIETYSRSLEIFKRRTTNSARIFGNIVSPNQESYPVPPNAPRYWEEYPNRKARESAPKGYDSYDGVEIWIRNGKVVIAEIQLDRTFAGASRRTIHYFRPDGTLAKTHNQYFESDYHTVKETTYDKEGKILHVRVRCVDTGGRGPGKLVKCPQSLPSQVDSPVYLKVENLPVNDLLTTQQ